MQGELNYMTEQQLMIAKARFDYFTILKGGLKKWLINDEEERKRLESVVNAIDEYRNFLADNLNKENN